MSSPGAKTPERRMKLSLKYGKKPNSLLHKALLRNFGYKGNFEEGTSDDERYVRGLGHHLSQILFNCDISCMGKELGLQGNIPL